MKSIFWRIILLAAFAASATALFLPSTPLQSRLPAFWVENVSKINLGLDLQGGTHLVLSVDQDKAVENHVKRLVDSVADALKKKNVAYSSVVRDGAAGIAVSYPDEAALASVKKTIDDDFGIFETGEAKDNRIVFTLEAREAARLREWALLQSLETIRNRIDKFGVAEPLIQKQGTNELVVQLPGLKDPDRAIQLIGKTAVLEFRLLDETIDAGKLNTMFIPPDDEILYQSERVKGASRDAS
ncbi:MAG: protein translocase subunit SecD, partial [Deltaproteobacteria bacterium]